MTEPSNLTITTGMAVASLCVEMIADDPELIKRLQEHVRKREAPFEADRLDEHALRVTDMLLTTHGFKTAKEGRDSVHEHMVIPVPSDKETAEQSAGALAAGSYLAEYMHKHPEALAGFGAWWDEQHPGDAGAITADRLEVVDELLTFMAAVVIRVTEGKEHRHTEDVKLHENDDGIRYV